MKKSILTILTSAILSLLITGTFLYVYPDAIRQIDGIASWDGKAWRWVSATNPLPTTATLTSSSLSPAGVSTIQGATLFNSDTTGAANTAVVVTIAAAALARAHIYGLDAVCSAGTSTITVTDGGVTKWDTLTGEVTTSVLRPYWPVGLTGSTNSAVVITLATCGGGNTGKLIVQADRF